MPASEAARKMNMVAPALECLHARAVESVLNWQVGPGDKIQRRSRSSARRPDVLKIPDVIARLVALGLSESLGKSPLFNASSRHTPGS